MRRRRAARCCRRLREAPLNPARKEKSPRRQSHGRRHPLRGPNEPRRGGWHVPQLRSRRARASPAARVGATAAANLSRALSWGHPLCCSARGRAGRGTVAARMRGGTRRSVTGRWSTASRTRPEEAHPRGVTSGPSRARHRHRHPRGHCRCRRRPRARGKRRGGGLEEMGSSRRCPQPRPKPPARRGEASLLRGLVRLRRRRPPTRRARPHRKPTREGRPPRLRRRALPRRVATRSPAPA
mmetsp:Transcript_40044/g.119531  ORF Transcript_40044/g.119531 Transcript_40044/m.119531 type:complete len:240 (-) Transcript_40044:523-1242(-)